MGQYKPITSQKEYDQLKAEQERSRDLWALGNVDAKMRINRIEMLLLDWRNEQDAKAAGKEELKPLNKLLPRRG